MVVINESKKKVSFLAIIFSLVLLGSFYSSEVFTDPFITAQHFFAMFAGIVIIFCGILYFTGKKYKLVYRLNKLDLSVLIYVVYLVIHYSFSGHLFTNNMSLLNLLLCAVIYFLYLPIFKDNVDRKIDDQFFDTLVGIIILIGIIQPIVGFLEYFNIISKIQTVFRIGGAFGNPGPYSNFLVAILPITLFAAGFYKKKILKYGGMVASILILVVLPLTQARTSWLSAVLIIAFAGFYVPKIRNTFKVFWVHKAFKAVTFLTFILTIVSLFIGLLSFKKDSASGRLFIWKVSAEMIKDKPLFGHGYNSFAVVHNEYQSEYFEANPNDSKNAYIADCVNFAFNEYIQITTEVGILGLVFFLGIVFFGIKGYITSSKNNSVIPKMGFGVFLAILLSSFLSYPLQSIPLLFLFFMGLLFISSHISDNRIVFSSQVKIRLIISGLGILACIIWTSVVYNRYKNEKEWKETIIMVRNNETGQAKIKYEYLSQSMSYNPYFYFNYGAELTLLGDYNKGIEILNSIEDRFNDVDYNLFLGACYEGNGNIRQAVFHYEKASNMMPIKFIPKYKLVILYDKLGRKNDAHNLAKQIMIMPVKIESDYIVQIRKELNNYLLYKSF